MRIVTDAGEYEFPPEAKRLADTIEIAKVRIIRHRRTILRIEMTEEEFIRARKEQECWPYDPCLHEQPGTICGIAIVTIRR